MSRTDRGDYEASEKDFEYFKQRCLYWKSVLGLSRYDFYFQFGGDKEDEGRFYGTVISTSSSMGATFNLCKTWKPERPVIRSEIDRLALHEVLHVLFTRFRELAESRYTSKNEIENEEEAVVTALTSVIIRVKS